MPRLLKLFLVVCVLLVIAYLAGPHPSSPIFSSQLPELPSSMSGIEAAVNFEEFKHPIKKNNEARIVWANDSTSPQKTPYAIVYLHGFSASQEEGNPVHRNIAKTFGCNLYLSRLADHGLDTADALIQLSADALWESAKKAYAIGKTIGHKVILMGTSTGASLALQLAATYPDIAGVVLISPNIQINNPNAWLLNNPWGLYIARQVQHANFVTAKSNTDAYKQYWYYQYRLEGAVALQEYLETAMVPATFARIKQPTLCLYYYKDEANQDPIVKVSAMKEMFAQLATPEAQKKMVAVPNANNHVLCSLIQSNDIETPRQAITSFLQQVIQK